MQEQYQILIQLLKNFPENNSYKSCSELSLILNTYKRILDYVNSYNQDYKSATGIYYTDITSIRDNIDQSVNSASSKEKSAALESAKNELKSNIQALAVLIQPKEESVEIPA